MQELTIEKASELLRYDPETGKLYWRKRPQSMFNSERIWKSWNSRYAEKEAGTPHIAGYIALILRGYGRFLAHRLIWFMETGEWPKDEIDHIDGDRSNNRFGNFREVSHQDNLKNCKKRSTNKSGVTGVYWHKQSKKWCARFVNSKKKSEQIGMFDCIGAASCARAIAENQRGFHINHGVR